MSGHAWFAGIGVDHLYADCPSRVRAEATLADVGWWDMSGDGIDPDGELVCGMCAARLQRTERAA